MAFGLTKFSGSDEKRGAPGELGACTDGAQYYEVKFGSGSRSKINNINGCYEKIDFHSVPLVATGKKFPIYKQKSPIYRYKSPSDNKRVYSRTKKVLALMFEISSVMIESVL